MSTTAIPLVVFVYCGAHSIKLLNGCGASIIVLCFGYGLESDCSDVYKIEEDYCYTILPVL